jgi:outer membrane protein assembly factor BamB
VGDFEGYLHWLDKSTGVIVARQKTDGVRITNAPISSEQGIYVQTDSGKLLAFRSASRQTHAEPQREPKEAPKEAPKEEPSADGGQ